MKQTFVVSQKGRKAVINFLYGRTYDEVELMHDILCDVEFEYECSESGSIIVDLAKCDYEKYEKFVCMIESIFYFYNQNIANNED